MTPSNAASPSAPLTKEHELKTWPSQYNLLASGAKTFEFRRNDRDFAVGDTLVLRDWNPHMECYEGREMRRRVTHILHGPEFGVPDGFVVMSLAPQSLEAGVTADDLAAIERCAVWLSAQSWHVHEPLGVEQREYVAKLRSLASRLSKGDL